MKKLSNNEADLLSESGVADVDEEDIDSPEPITSPFDPSKINVVREPMSVFQVMRKIEIDEIQLDPDFQRNLVWDLKRQSQLIESVLLKIPLPAFYLDAVKPDRWVVVDGLQRLSTIKSFMTDNALVLRGLEFLSRQFEGKRFRDLPRSSQRDIEETQLTLFTIRPETPPKVKFTIFHRINTGGMVLTAQEIRHATFPGRAPGMLRLLAESDAFLNATVRSINPRRMDDRECVLRHLAFRITKYEDYAKPDLNDFLGSAMNSINSASESDTELMRLEFERSMRLCHKIFGIYAFRKFSRGDGSRGPLNKPLFESWSTAVLDFDEASLIKRASKILDGLEIALREDIDYTKSLSLATGGVNPIRKRFSKAYQIIEEAI